MRIHVVNCSSKLHKEGSKIVEKVYNLGCAKWANHYRRAGWDVVERSLDWFSHGDVALLSAIFTKDLMMLEQQALLARHKNMKVHIGGPAVTMLSEYVQERTGVEPHIGLHPLVENEPGQYQWTFTSRGCPRNCQFCLVTQLEGHKVVENDAFLPAPNIGDNNILMTSTRHQDIVIQRTLEAGFPSVDINSGFDCRVFESDADYYYKKWSRLPLSMWRFAFDCAEEEGPIRRTFEYLQRAGMDRHKVQAYVLCNFPGTTPEEVRYRAEVIKGYGMMPYLMVYRPVDSVRHDYIAPGWSPKEITRMTGYYNQPGIWMTCEWEEYSGQAKRMEGALKLPM